MQISSPSGWLHASPSRAPAGGMTAPRSSSTSSHPLPTRPLLSQGSTPSRLQNLQHLHIPLAFVRRVPQAHLRSRQRPPQALRVGHRHARWDDAQPGRNASALYAATECRYLDRMENWSEYRRTMVPSDQRESREGGEGGEDEYDEGSDDDDNDYDRCCPKGAFHWEEYSDCLYDAGDHMILPYVFKEGPETRFLLLYGDATSESEYGRGGGGWRVTFNLVLLLPPLLSVFCLCVDFCCPLLSAISLDMFTSRRRYGGRRARRRWFVDGNPIGTTSHGSNHTPFLAI